MMYTLEISYKMAIDGKYKGTTPDSDSFGQYFHQMGATVHHHTVPIADLDFTDDHLNNIAGLIYYVKKIGYDILSLSLDDGDSYSAIKDRFYLISSLPEVHAKIHELKDGQKVLFVSFEEDYDSLMEAGLDGMSDEDIVKMIDDSPFKTDIDSTIPDEIISKYETELSPEEKERIERDFTKACEGLAAIFKKSNQS